MRKKLEGQRREQLSHLKRSRRPVLKVCGISLSPPLGHPLLNAAMESAAADGCLAEEEAAEPSADGTTPWHHTLQVEVERSGALSLAAERLELGCCTELLRHCSEDDLLSSRAITSFAASAATNAAATSLLSSAFDRACTEARANYKRLDGLGEGEEFPDHEELRLGTVPILDALLGRLSPAALASWLLSRPSAAQMTACFRSDDLRDLTSLSLADGTLQRALGTVLKLDPASLRRALDAAGLSGVDADDDWRAVLAGLRRGSEQDIKTKFELQRLVAAAHELLPPPSPLLIALMLQQNCALECVSGPPVPYFGQGFCESFGHHGGGWDCAQPLVEALLARLEACLTEAHALGGVGPMHLAAALAGADTRVEENVGIVSRLLTAGSRETHSQRVGARTLVAGASPLAVACVNGNAGAAKALLAAGASGTPGPTDPLNDVLHACAATFQLQSVRFLLSMGARVEEGAPRRGELKVLDHVVTRYIRRSLATGGSWENLDSWHETVDALVKKGADLLHAPAPGRAPIQLLLGHCPWELWPQSARAALRAALPAEAAAAAASAPAPATPPQTSPKLEPAATPTTPLTPSAGDLRELWEGASLHAFALAPPTAECVDMAERLLAAGASANARTAGKQQTALHLLAAGGAYQWSADNGLVLRGPVLDGEVNAARIATLLLESGANWRSRDAGDNLPAHLACAAGTTDVAKALHKAGSGFDRPWLNRQRRTPLELAHAAGDTGRGAVAYISAAKQALAAARARREAEARKLAEGGTSSIDALLQANATAALLLPPLAGAAAEAAALEPASAATASAASIAPAAAVDAEEQREEEERAKQLARLALLGLLRFGGLRWQVVLTQHSKQQLRLLRSFDEARLPIRISHACAQSGSVHASAFSWCAGAVPRGAQAAARAGERGGAARGDEAARHHGAAAQPRRRQGGARRGLGRARALRRRLL